MGCLERGFGDSRERDALLMDGIARGVYPATAALVDWLSENFDMLEKSSFLHIQSIRKLLPIVNAAESGRLPRYAALSALRDYNTENKTQLTYEEVRDLDCTYAFAGECPWVLLSDSTKTIVLNSDYDTPEEALTNAPSSVRFIFIWDTANDVICVYRSPHIGYRQQAFENEGVLFCDGESSGEVYAYLLPPEVEASLHEYVFMRSGVTDGSQY